MVVPEDEMVGTLIEWAEYIHTHGAQAALARASSTRSAARRAAAQDRDRNLVQRGDDANNAKVTIANIRRASKPSDPKATR